MKSDTKNITYCMYELDAEGKGYKKVEKGSARFHQWGISYELIDGSVGQYTTAIIELPDGTIENVPAENIRFIDATNMQ